MKRFALLAPVLLLAACEDKPAAPAEQGGAASGEILQGSVSDAMIPLDQLKSEAPLAPRQAPVDTAAGLDGEQPDVVPVDGVDAAPAAADVPEATPAAVPPGQPQQ
jgi:hypothetical protein